MPSAHSSSKNSRYGFYLLAQILAANVLLPSLLAIPVYIAIAPKIEEYDVFVSFRGADIRHSFLSHLQSALRQKSIKAFIDDQIIGGDLIRQRLFNAIADSKVAVIIFSKNYALSEDCLDELVKIVECHAHRETCIPIFYNVCTSDVMHQSGDFEQAFVAHEENSKQLDKLERWRKAMSNITNHKGWDSTVIKSEADLIDELIEHVSWKLKRTPAKYQPRRQWPPYFILSVLMICASMAVTWHFSQQQQAEAHEHDVFVNFYGEITLFRKLVDALDKAGIKIFKDHELADGEHMAKTIEKAIKGSKVAVIIFSAGYAYSARCLDELVKILDCRKSQGLELVPVCYRINDRDVKQPERFFEEAFGRHRKRRSEGNVQRWQKAMKEAASDATLIPQPRQDRNTAASGPTQRQWLRQLLNRKKGKDEFSIIPEIVAAVQEKLRNKKGKSLAGARKNPVSFTYRLCLSAVSFLVSLLALMLSDEMLIQSLVGGEIIRETQCMPL